MLISWPLNGSKIPLPGRIEPIHNVMRLDEGGATTTEGWDDEITFNTQVVPTISHRMTLVLTQRQKSSQWDSLVHWQGMG